MTSVRDTYFGWAELPHAEVCKRPVWDVNSKVEHDVAPERDRYSTAPHDCPDEECDHGARYTRTTVRIVCRSCGEAHLLASDRQTVRTSTGYLGYGQQPRRVAGLLLWPGEPLSTFGMSVRDGRQYVPYELLVTGQGVTRPRREDLVGEIAQTMGRRGAVRYGAVRGLDPNGEYGWGDFRWSAAAEGLHTIAAAAKWIAAGVGAVAGAGVSE